MLRWHAFHIFYFSDPQPILEEFNKIFKRARNSYGYFDYFFIRYWNGGPHLRLRVKTNSKKILDFLLASINDLLNNRPSKVFINKEQYLESERRIRISSKEEEPLLPMQKNNSILITDYHPEYQKYFGVEGVKIAEEEFVYSSKLVLKIIAMKKPKGLNYLISVAFLDYLLSSVRMNLDYRRFTSNYGNYWKDFTSNRGNNNHSANIKFTEEAIEKAQSIILSRDVFNFHKHIFEEIDKQFSNKSRSLSFLFNFFHLFNNRLGITPSEEVIVSNIAYNSL